ncbi:hypothetical protein AB0X79_07775 [Pediococcus pentosaceus]|uniref:hypothetical protein n=1 Tax=Pediococcus pentosaceus TaxID=1255 RepID=UPI003F271D78
MTKDELNKVLKKDGMYLSPVSDGTFNDIFYVVNESCIVAEFNGVDFIFSRDDGQGYGKKTVAALIEYANTPIEERKPKPQLFNIIIAQEHDDGETWYTTWRKIKNSTFETAYATTLGELNHEDYQFTQKEIDLLKKELPENQKKIVDLGVTTIPSDKEKVVPF